MKKAIIILLVLLLAITLIFGCTEPVPEEPKNELLGTWETTQGATRIEFIFNEENEFGSMSYNGETAMQQIIGNYSTDGNLLMLKPTKSPGNIDLNIEYTLSENTLTLSGISPTSDFIFTKKSDSMEIIEQNFSQITQPIETIKPLGTVCQSKSTGMIVESDSITEYGVNLVIRNATGQAITLTGSTGEGDFSGTGTLMQTDISKNSTLRILDITPPAKGTTFSNGLIKINYEVSGLNAIATIVCAGTI